MIKRAVIALLIVLMMATAVPAREFEGVDMPESIQIDSQTVVLNGVGMRKIMFIKPYVGGLYLTSAQKDGNTIMKADEPMAIRLNMIDDVGQKMMLRAFYNGMRSSVKATGGDMTALEPRFEQLKGYFTDEIKEGEIYEFKYLPGKGLTVYKNNKAYGTVPGMDFKTAFFGIWLNDASPADSDLKVAMLAGDVRATVPKADDSKAKAEAEKKAAEEAALKAAEAAKQQALLAAEEKVKADALAKAESEMKAAQEKTKAGETKVAAAADAVVQAKTDAGKTVADEKALAEEKAKVAETKTVEAETAAQSQVSAVETKAIEEKAAVSEKIAQVAPETKAVVAVPVATSKTVAAVIPVLPPIKSAWEVEIQDIYFGSNNSSLSNSAQSILNRKIEWMKANPSVKVIVEVYADSQGSKEYNMKLSEQRAQSVTEYMNSAGIESSRVETKVYGAEDAQADATTASLAKSRRAHFRIIQ